MDPLPPTPSLIGLSIRDIDDSHSPQPEEDANAIMNSQEFTKKALDKMHLGDNFSKNSYSNLDDLNSTGALLTDDMELNPEGDVPGDSNSVKMEDDEDYKLNNYKEQGIEDDRSEKLASEKTLKQQKKAFLDKQKQKNRDNVTFSLNERTNLVTSTDPINEGTLSRTMSPTRQTLINHDLDNNLGSASKVKNSFGEYIVNESNRPHLARGDSYQSVNSNSATKEEEDRIGRAGNRSSTDYLRSLSKSLTRDHSHSNGNSRISRGKGPVDGAEIGETNNDSLNFSTNNYGISQDEMEVAAKKLIAEEDEGNNARHL